MRFVILLVVGIIALYPARGGGLVAFSAADNFPASDFSRAPISTFSLHRVDPYLPLNARRDYVIEACFEQEEEETEGFSTWLSLPGSISPHFCSFFTPVASSTEGQLNSPLRTGHSVVLRC